MISSPYPVLQIARVSAIFLALAAFRAFAGESEAWPGFRGMGNETSLSLDLPLHWSGSENVAWRAPLAGYGQSSPVAWGGKVYATSTGGQQKERLFLQCFDLESGRVLWEKTFEASQKAAEVSDMISRGAPTPVADAAGIYAFFESGDLVALGHEGTVRWERHLTKEFGEFQGGHGIGSSLVDTPEGLVLLADHDGPSYLLCVDKTTGQTRWKTERTSRVSWTTPLYLSHGGTDQVLISSNGVVQSYAAADGRLLWEIDGLKGNTVASPTLGGGLAIIGSSQPKNSLAVRLDSTETGNSRIAWRAESVTISFASPLIHDGTVYFVSKAGVLQANRLSDGTSLWERRLPDSCWASPLAAGDRLYFFCKNGQTVILPAKGLDASTEPLATNPIPVPEGSRLYGCAALPGRLILRTGSELFSVGKAARPSP